jgi:6-pyruvoyltetrahydropterin/6-carboxytetrahydropterin synthase
MSSFTSSATQALCMGHRVVGDLNECSSLHGHSYQITFVCKETLNPSFHDEEDDIIRIGKRKIQPPVVQTGLDHFGFVLEDKIMKNRLCQWVKNEWHGKFLHWSRDTMIEDMQRAARARMANSHHEDPAYFVSKAQLHSYVELDFNPTAENLAAHLVNVVGPAQLKGFGVTLVKVTIQQGYNYSVEYSI